MDTSGETATAQAVLPAVLPAEPSAVLRWSVVLPVKPLHLAKTRLAVAPAPLRADLVLAMAADTVQAALGCARVDLVIVVTDDPRAAAGLTALGALVVPDSPDAGLNAALAHGAQLAAARAPACGVATVSADLAALRSEELRRALAAAAAYPRAFVADAAGNGTTLVAARDGRRLTPAYGTGSRDRHVRAGWTELLLDDVPGLRQDVDTVEDLDVVRRLGTGPHTRAVLARLAGSLPIQ